MFTKNIILILKKAEIVISEVMFDYLESLSEEAIKNLSDLILCYGNDDIFKTIGKIKIQKEMHQIQALAEDWHQKKKIDPNQNFSDKSNFFTSIKEQIDKFNFENSSQISTFVSKNVSDKQKEAMANIEITNIDQIPIHKNYQLDLLALQFPLFSLKLNKKAEDFTFVDRNNLKITISSGTAGRATIYDSDLWLYCITKLIQINYQRGKNNHTRRVQFTGYDFLKSTGRSTSGANYKQLIKSLERLAKTNISFSKEIGNLEAGEISSLLENARFIYDENEKKMGVEVFLPVWLYDEIKDLSIATINPEYLKLKPFQKRIYHLAKYHCRNQKQSATFNLDYFAQKVGSNNKNLYDFKKEIKKLTESQPIPEYRIHFDDENKQVYFTNILLETDQEKVSKNEETLAVRHNDSSQNMNEIKRILEFFEKFCPPSKKENSIFKTKILTEKKLAEYLKKFNGDYILSKISDFIDFDFGQCKNPEGYFYTVLKNDVLPRE